MKTRLFILSGLILFVIPLWLQLRKGFTAAQLQLTSTPAFSLYLPLIQKPEITWSQTSQGMETADFFTFAVSPAYSIDKTLFAGTYMFTGGGTGGAIYKSIDGGVSWQLVNDGLAGEAITTLAISPNYFTDRTLFVGTLGSCSSGSIHKSTDGGISWESSGTFSQNAEDIAISPSYATDFTVFATVGYGVYKTINGGATWIGVYTRPLSYGWATKLAISPAYSTDHIVFVKSGNYEVSKSTDGGAMWTQLPPLSGVVNAIAISPNYLIDQTLFATVSSANPYFLKIYKSIDSGLSWVQVSPNLPPALNKNSIQISSGYASDHTLYVIASSNYTTILQTG